MRRERAVDVDEHRPSRARLHAPGVVLFLSFVDVFALLPTVAPHVEALGAGPLGLGITVAAYSAANLPANIVGGVLIDRFGRRPVLIVGLVLAALAVSVYPLAATVPAFVVARLLHGTAGGILTPAAFAVAGDRMRNGEAGRSFGRLGAVIGLAAVVAPAAAGVVRQSAGTDAVFLGVAGVLLVASVVAVGWIRDVAALPSGEVLEVDVAAAPPRRTALRELLGEGPLRRGLVATVTLTAAVGVLAGFLPGAAEDVGAPPSAVGGLFTTYAVVAGALMLSPLSGRVDRDSSSRIAATGLGSLAAALLVVAIGGELWVLYLGAALFGAGYGLVFPAVAAVTSTTADLRSRGRAFGLFNAAFSLGIAGGPPLVGLLVERVPALDAFVPTGLATAVVAIALLWGRRPNERH